MQIEEETFFGAVLTHSSPIYISDRMCWRIYSDDDDDHDDDANLSVCASTLYYIYREREKTGRVRIYKYT